MLLGRDPNKPKEVLFINCGAQCGSHQKPSVCRMWIFLPPDYAGTLQANSDTLHTEDPAAQKALALQVESRQEQIGYVWCCLEF